MAFPLLNLDVFWNSSRAWAYKFQETPELGETPLPPSTKAIILTVSGISSPFGIGKSMREHELMI